MKKITLILASLLFFIGCKKTNDPIPNDPVTSMENLVISKEFGWSASLSGKLTVKIQNPYNASLEQEYLMIIDDQGTILDRQIVADSAAEFDVVLPKSQSYYLYFPVTDDHQKITELGTISMVLGPTVEYTNPQSKSSIEVTCTSCESPIVNTGAEEPYLASGYSIVNASVVPGWETTATDNKIEVWVSGFNGVPAQEGRQFFEINANRVGALYQELCLEPGSTVHWSVWHRGRSGVDVANVQIGASVESAEIQTTMTDGNTAWGYYSGTYNVPLGQTTTFFVFNSVSSTGGNSYGNFLDNFEISCDADGDGIIDRWDDQPDDPNVAFTTYFPESGKQILAFEDLWPYLGDFDFNDLVLSNQAVITKNAAGRPLEANFTISIDAIGASYDNGFAMMLYNTDKGAFSGNIIESITGDATLDPDNVNGIIISNDVFETTNDRYQNNGVGANGVPDTLNFTITFNTSAADFIPEIYLFRTSDRGLEVHRSGFPQTATANPAYFNTGHDAGDYKTESGLPWAMEIITDQHFKCAIEKIEILDAYPQFESWAVSNGAENPLWYQNPVEDKVVTINFE